MALVRGNVRRVMGVPTRFRYTDSYVNDIESAMDRIDALTLGGDTSVETKINTALTEIGVAETKIKELHDLGDIVAAGTVQLDNGAAIDGWKDYGRRQVGIIENELIVRKRADIFAPAAMFANGGNRLAYG